jgi:hypothetical protein
METEIDYMTQRHRCVECGGWAVEDGNGEAVHEVGGAPECRLGPAATWDTIGGLDDDSDYLDFAAALLYPLDDPRARTWPDPQTVGRVRSRLRSLADHLREEFEREERERITRTEREAERNLHSFNPADHF